MIQPPPLSSPLPYRPLDTLPPELITAILTSAPTVTDAVALSRCSRRLHAIWEAYLDNINYRTAFSHDPRWYSKILRAHVVFRFEGRMMADGVEPEMLKWGVMGKGTFWAWGARRADWVPDRGEGMQEEAV